MIQSKRNRLKRLENITSKHSAPIEDYVHITDEELDEWYHNFIEELASTPADEAFNNMTSDEAITYYFQFIQ